MDDPPAFSRPMGFRPDLSDCIDNGAEGMTLRDYFAASILQGIIQQTYKEEMQDTRVSWEQYDAKMTKRAWEIAEQMIQKRPK